MALKNVATTFIAGLVISATGCSGTNSHVDETASADTSADGGLATTYAMLPTGPIALVAQLTAVGTASVEECNDDDCDDPRYVVISTSAPTAVQCSFTGENPGTVQATCSIAIGYAYPTDCPEISQCNYGVGTEPVWGPETATVASTGQFQLTFGDPASEPWQTGAYFTGNLADGMLAVSIRGSTSSTTTTGTGQGTLAPTGTVSVQSCNIGGTVYTAGAANSANPCQVCTPSLAYGAWSYMPLPDWNVAVAGPAPAEYYGVCGGQCVNTETYGLASGYGWCGSENGNVCMDTQSDPDNCGVCGKTCAAGQQCSNGSCVGTPSSCEYTFQPENAAFEICDWLTAPTQCQNTALYTPGSCSASRLYGCCVKSASATCYYYATNSDSPPPGVSTTCPGGGTWRTTAP